MNYADIVMIKLTAGQTKGVIEPDFARGPCFPHPWSQFHQHFTCSFYTRRSQKRKNDSQLKQLFSLSGSACVKAACKMLVKLTPGGEFVSNTELITTVS